MNEVNHPLAFRHNFIEQDFIKNRLDDVSIIPMHEIPKYFHEIKLLGWDDKNVTLDFNDKNLNEIIGLCGCILEGYIQFYKEKYEFAYPALVYIPEKGFSIRIGIREKEDDRNNLPT